MSGNKQETIFECVPDANQLRNDGPDLGVTGGKRSGPLSRVRPD
jgi:hypothetical protein